MSVSRAFRQQTSITLSGGPIKEEVTLVDGQYTIVDDITFMRASKTAKYVRKMLSLPRYDDKDARILSNTSIFEDITKLRNDNYDELVNAAAFPDAKTDESLSFGKGGSPSGPRRVSRIVAAALPKYASISAPSVGDVSGIELKAIVGNKSSPLFIELSESTIEYLSAVCHHQITVGGFKRNKNGSSKRTAVDPIDADDADAEVKVAKVKNALVLQTDNQKMKLKSDALGKFKFTVRNRRRKELNATAAPSSSSLAKYFKLEPAKRGLGIQVSVMGESATGGAPC